VSWPLPATGQTTAETEVSQESQPSTTREEGLRRKREAKAQELAPYTVSKAEARVLAFEAMNFPANVFQRGWRRFVPVIGGMPSGSGLVGGLGYHNGLDNEAFEFDASARISTRLFTSYDAAVRFPAARRSTPVRGRVTFRNSDYRDLRFFGLGSDTQSRDRSTYQLLEQAVDAGVGADLGRFVNLDVHAGWLRADAEEGFFGPSLDELFDPLGVPGFETTTNYLHYGATVELDLRDSTVPEAGVVFRGEIAQYDDRDLDRFDFNRVAGEVQVHIPLGVRSRLLALRARTSRSVAASGSEVPFYLMETLGGGSTIRGFREFRFRDARTLLFSAEYRWELWTYLDFAVFADAGKVFSESSELDLHNLETAVGFGLRGHGPGGTVIRFDLARSREAIKVHIGGGPSF
jgi:outer membrane protein assembly factor BamA